MMEETLKELSSQVAEILRILKDRSAPVKEWYSTDELAFAVKKSAYTVREKWCNAGRIECEKDPYTGKWRIPGREYERLVNGGSPRQPSSRAIACSSAGNKC